MTVAGEETSLSSGELEEKSQMRILRNEFYLRPKWTKLCQLLFPKFHAFTNRWMFLPFIVFFCTPEYT